MNNTLIPNTNITVKEFQKLLFEHFNAYPMLFKDYKKNQIKVTRTFYDCISITLKKLVAFCKKHNVNYELGCYYIIIKLN